MEEKFITYLGTRIALNAELLRDPLALYLLHHSEWVELTQGKGIKYLEFLKEKDFLMASEKTLQILEKAIRSYKIAKK